MWSAYEIVKLGPMYQLAPSCAEIVIIIYCFVFSLTVVIKKFAKQLEDWIGAALNDLPESLRLMKLNSKLLILPVILKYRNK